MTKITVKQTGPAFLGLYGPAETITTAAATDRSGTSATMLLEGGRFRYVVTGTGLQYNGANELVDGTVSKITMQYLLDDLSTWQTTLVATGVNLDVEKARAMTLDGGHYPLSNNVAWDWDARTLAADQGLVQYTAVGNFNDKFLTGGAPDFIEGVGGKDTLTTAGGNDWLDGGDGNDKLDGGKGNDTLLAGNGNDTVVGGKGVDMYYAVSLTSQFATTNDLRIDLAAGKATGLGNDKLSGIENATGSLGDDTMIGDGKSNMLIGQNGKDQIKGGGGSDFLIGLNQVDSLWGGAGRDYFGLEYGKATADKVMDFNQKDDFIPLNPYFFGLDVGADMSPYFVKGKAAIDGDDYFIYDRASGKLWWDVDGSGAQKAQLMATFVNHANLTAANIVVVDPDTFWV